MLVQDTCVYGDKWAVSNEKGSVMAEAIHPEVTTEVLDAFASGLESSSRRDRQVAAANLAKVTANNPEALVPYVSLLVSSLDKPEAQTRWECLDMLSQVVDVESRLCDKALPGAENALFDEGSGLLHLSAMKFLCKLGATTQNRSQKVWPLIDEGIQCYHGDNEFPDMLNALIDFSAGELAPAVKAELGERMAFDAANGKGQLKKRASIILENVKQK